MDTPHLLPGNGQPDLNYLIGGFEKIALDRMNEAKLLNRFDSKYWVHANQLKNILEKIAADYYILDINGTKIQSYRNIYYDTPSATFYIMHHNGKAGRIKIRKREYVESGIYFLEIKGKSNKEKTNKIRVATASLAPEFSEDEKEFLYQNTNLDCTTLAETSFNSFNRITLVSKQFDERCTIDFGISFYQNGRAKIFHDLIIIELKQSTPNQKSRLSKVLKLEKSYPLGFSKYCIGRALFSQSLKTNRFKAKLLKLKKQFDSAA